MSGFCVFRASQFAKDCPVGFSCLAHDCFQIGCLYDWLLSRTLMKMLDFTLDDFLHGHCDILLLSLEISLTMIPSARPLICFIVHHHLLAVLVYSWMCVGKLSTFVHLFVNAPILMISASTKLLRNNKKDFFMRKLHICRWYCSLWMMQKTYKV